MLAPHFARLFTDIARTFDETGEALQLRGDDTAAARHYRASELAAALAAVMGEIDEAEMSAMALELV